jgi:hypothetical protein
LHARLAANAARAVKINDAVGPAKQRNGGTNFDARSVIAVIAAKHGEMASRIRIVPFLDVFNPRPVDPDRYIVFLLTGDRASVTADAAVLVNEKSVAH